MNDKVRKQWNEAKSKLEGIVGSLQEMQSIQEEEQERYDNLSEGAQQKADDDENGSAVRDADVQSAIDAIEELIGVEP